MNNFRSICCSIILRSLTLGLVFMFCKETLQAPLLWLTDNDQSYELFESMTAEETSDDSESEKKEKKEGAEEFIITDAAEFFALAEINKFLAYSFNQSFKSRVTEMITPPPQPIFL